MQNNKPQNTNFERCVQQFLDKKINLRKDFYINKEKFRNTSLYNYFNQMPKGVLNHVHFPAFTSIDEWLDILKHDVCIKDVENGIYAIAPKDKKLDFGFRR